jgi:hypothetical protein
VDIVDVMDKYVGDLIERIIEQDYMAVEMDLDYIDLLLFIYRRLNRIWFGNNASNEDDFARTLRMHRLSNPEKLKVLLSFLISRYITAKYTKR